MSFSYISNFLNKILATQSLRIPRATDQFHFKFGRRYIERKARLQSKLIAWQALFIQFPLFNIIVDSRHHSSGCNKKIHGCLEVLNLEDSSNFKSYLNHIIMLAIYLAEEFLKNSFYKKRPIRIFER